MQNIFLQSLFKEIQIKILTLKMSTPHKYVGFFRYFVCVLKFC